MINACTFLTRKCPRNCNYCNASKIKKEDELDWLDWVQVNSILKKIGVGFNLILGNETWLLGSKLNRIMSLNEVPYALYTTCPPHLFNRYKDEYFGDNGCIDNLSCGIDHSLTHLSESCKTDMEIKSGHGWMGLDYVRTNYPHVDCQGTVTIHKQNYTQLPEIVENLSQIDVFIGVNVIHWNKDNGFDFFPHSKNIRDFLFSKRDIPKLQKIFENVLGIKDALIQNREMLNPNLVPHLIKTDWHCRGNPYGGPTIDSDGMLRCCGYRKGKQASQYSIFDLPKSFDSYMKAVEADALECPGCFWSYPYLYKFWEGRNGNFIKKAFVNHARPDIPREKWSIRIVE